MLVLTRKLNEAIIAGKNGEIKIVVIDIAGDRVRIGVDAPNDIPVHRQEVWDAIQREGRRG